MERINMIQKPYRSFFLICTAFVMALSACASPEAPAPTLDVNEIVNQVAATIEMGFTQTALAMPTATSTPEPTITPLPSATLQPLIATTPTVAASPTLTGPTPLPVNPATANGCYNAALVSEGTVPNRTDFKSGDTFQKTWRLVNTGTCEWNGEFKIAHVSGDYFGSDTTKIRQRVGVGIIADVSLEMEAPGGLSGTVVSNWQMVTDTGLSFGPLLTVSIILPGTNATATSVGCYSSALVSETIPAGSKMDPGERFEKTWTIKNTGTCDWVRDFMFEFAGGYDFQGADRVRITQKVAPGATVDISMSIDAPTDPDSYSSSWQMATDDGSSFGRIFTIDIKVR
jgi:hypothetical protein